MKDRLRTLVAGIIENEGIDLLEIATGGGRGNRIIRFFVDRDGGIGVDECARLSRELSDVLDFHQDDLGLDRYRLEVSSPGIDRPLRSETDFSRNVGRMVTMTHRTDEGISGLEGRIKGIQDSEVIVTTDEGETVVPLSAVEQAKIKPEW